MGRGYKGATHSQSTNSPCTKETRSAILKKRKKKKAKKEREREREREKTYIATHGRLFVTLSDKFQRTSPFGKKAAFKLKKKKISIHHFSF